MAKQEFSYVTRIAKWIERHVVLDALTRMSTHLDFGDYHYVGFGALEFVDFQLFHRQLHVTEMISIDKATDERTRKRLSANKPFDCIDLRFGDSRNVIPRLDLERRKSIIWLDYEDKLDLSLVSEIRDVAQRLPHGSILLVTMNAHPDELNDRVSRARDRLGDDFLEAFAGKVESPSSYGRKGLPKLQSQVLRSVVNHATRPNMAATSFLSLTYADEAQMQTIAWIVWDQADQSMIDGIKGLDWSANAFVKACLANPEPVVALKPPMLTSRERTELDAVLPAGNALARGGELGLTEEWVERYRGIYRWYPRYVGAVVSA